MERTIDEHDLDIEDWVPGNHARIERFFDSLLGRSDIFLWNGAANDLVLEYEP